MSFPKHIFQKFQIYFIKPHRNGSFSMIFSQYGSVVSKISPKLFRRVNLENRQILFYVVANQHYCKEKFTSKIIFKYFLKTFIYLVLSKLLPAPEDPDLGRSLIGQKISANERSLRHPISKNFSFFVFSRSNLGIPRQEF